MNFSSWCFFRKVSTSSQVQFFRCFVENTSVTIEAGDVDISECVCRCTKSLIIVNIVVRFGFTMGGGGGVGGFSGGFTSSSMTSKRYLLTFHALIFCKTTFSRIIHSLEKAFHFYICQDAHGRCASSHPRL